MLPLTFCFFWILMFTMFFTCSWISGSHEFRDLLLLFFVLSWFQQNIGFPMCSGFSGCSGLFVFEDKFIVLSKFDTMDFMVSWFYWFSRLGIFKIVFLWISMFYWFSWVLGYSGFLEFLDVHDFIRVCCKCSEDFGEPVPQYQGSRFPEWPKLISFLDYKKPKGQSGWGKRFLPLSLSLSLYIYIYILFIYLFFLLYWTPPHTRPIIPPIVCTLFFLNWILGIAVYPAWETVYQCIVAVLELSLHLCSRVHRSCFNLTSQCYYG